MIPPAPGVLQSHSGHSFDRVKKIILHIDCNTIAISPLGKLHGRPGEMEKLAVAQVSDRDCDHDEESSSKHCLLGQISELSIVPTPCSQPASLINRRGELPKLCK